MTNKEKAKAYDEALAKAKEMMNNNCSSETTKAVCQELFTELAESEDEMARKEILNYILYKASGVSEEDEHRWVTWLEKQKENTWSEEDDAKVKVMCEEGDLKPSERAWLKDLSNRVWKEQKSAKVLYIPKFRTGDMVISTKNPRLTYKILNIESMNELGNPYYEVEIFTDGKPDEPLNLKHIEIEKMDSWKARFSRPDDIPIKATMAFTARMFYMYPDIAREWYVGLPKAILD